MKKIGYIGLGKMGIGMAMRLKSKGWDVVATDASKDALAKAHEKGLAIKSSVSELVSALAAPRLVWIMVPHAAVDAVVAELLPILEKGDIVIDGGNSFYKESVRRGGLCAEKGIYFMDAGVSGGPEGAAEGACVMVGADKEIYAKHEDLFKDIAAPGAYAHVGPIGAGHFVKMVHNGIEYGMMQAIGEGFEVLKKSQFHPDLKEVARIYDTRSVIESRLTGWLTKAFAESGTDLAGISGSVAHSGEGLWTVETAKELNVPVPVIEASLEFREESAKRPSYTGQVVSALRNQFGGHDVKKKT